MEEFKPKEVMMAEPLSHSEGLLELIRVDFVVSFAASLPAPLQTVAGVAMILASTWAAWRTFRVLLSWTTRASAFLLTAHEVIDGAFREIVYRACMCLILDYRRVGPDCVFTCRSLLSQ